MRACLQSREPKDDRVSGDSPATRPRRDWLDIMAVFVSSISAVLTAWSGFEASKWGGEMSIAFSQASSARVQVEAGPFAVPEYIPPGTVEAQELNERADAKFPEALTNNQRGDNYSLLTVLFALVLFLTAMSQRDLAPWARKFLLIGATALGAVGVVILATFPIRI